MTAFVDACVDTVTGSANKVERSSRRRAQAKRLLRVLQTKKRILITTHLHPDPDALASSVALRELLRKKLPAAIIELSVAGKIGGGMNEAFNRYVDLSAVPWDFDALAHYDAIVLLDVQPNFAYSPLPASVAPTVVIDHHRARGRRPKGAFVDICPDIGSTTSMIFSYFMELDVPISAELATTMLYGIESDLAGAAGTPSSMDNMALSSLTLLADTHKLYQMRYVTLPQNYYRSFYAGLGSAMFYDSVLIAHIGPIDSPEQPAIIADFLLRFDSVQWTLVTATQNDRLILSLRTRAANRSAGDVMKRLLHRLGEGGGHRTKAGGYIPLQTVADAELERQRAVLRRRLLRNLGVRAARGQRLVQEA